MSVEEFLREVSYCRRIKKALSMRIKFCLRALELLASEAGDFVPGRSCGSGAGGRVIKPPRDLPTAAAMDYAVDHVHNQPFGY
jgi:hypothetical protein